MSARPAGRGRRVFGPAIAALLLAFPLCAPRALAQTTPAPPLDSKYQLFARGPAVAQLRVALAALHYLENADGDLYDLTVLEAVRRFQRDKGLHASGMARASTLRALRGALGAEPAPTAQSSPAASPAPASPAPTPVAGSPPRGAPGAPTFAGAGFDEEACRARMGGASLLQAQAAASLQAKLPFYEGLRDNGKNGWLKLEKGAAYGLGEAHPTIPALRARLATEGYLREDAADGTLYDATLRDALRRFQTNHGLPPRDVVDRSELAAFNVPANHRVEEIKGSLARLHAATTKLRAAGPYLVLNIPTAMLDLVEDGRIVDCHLAIVGKRNHQRKTDGALIKSESPELVSAVVSIIPAPDWTAPPGIVKNEVLPGFRRDSQYFAKRDMMVLLNGREVDPSAVGELSERFSFVQRPGANNPLGLLKFDMENTPFVYMHDTNQKGLFNALNRFKSHGCARIKDPVGLAARLLQYADASFTRERVQALIDTQQHAGVYARGAPAVLKRKIPTVWTYLTAWTTREGDVAFARSDIYRKDIK